MVGDENQDSAHTQPKHTDYGTLKAVLRPNKQFFFFFEFQNYVN